YTAMLSESARASIGVPHTSGRAAMRMLENENFSYDGYVDIFDGGPTMIAKTNDVTSIRNSQSAAITDIADGSTKSIISHGSFLGFQATYAMVTENAEGVTIDAEAAQNLGLSVGDMIRHIPR
ncbi:MAG: arginine N-succinyltransferase, partial [Marinomonas sp.]